MSSPEVTIHIASINTRHATELAIRSAHRLAGAEHRMVIGDCNSSDGSQTMLRDLADRGLIELEVAAGPRSHASWLDQWLDSCTTEWAVFLDSDIQLRRPDWLAALLQRGEQSAAAVVGGERTEDAPDGRTAEGEVRFLVGCRAAPWIMLCHVPTLRKVGASFAPRTVESVAGPPRFYDVASWQQSQLVDSGHRIELMPPSFRRSYRHFAGLSWRRDTGWKGWIRHRLRYARLYLSLNKERVAARLR